jgi:copper chaperone CopZ
MKRWLLFVLVVLGLCVPGCRRQDIRTIMIDVPGMETDEHAAKVMQAMRTIPGVDTNSVRVDFARHTVTVRYESLVASLKNIEMAIAEAGFAANDVPANAEAAARLSAGATNRPAAQRGR